MARYRMFVEAYLDMPKGLPPTTSTLQRAARQFKKIVAAAPLPTKLLDPYNHTIPEGRVVWCLNNNPTDHAVWVLENPELELVLEKGNTVE